jgi:S1-C subfamily serine protease
MGQRHDLGQDGKPDLLGSVLPRTVVGLALWLLIFAIGAGASGVVFFIAYERRQTELESRITAVKSELEQRLADAVAQLQQADRANVVTGTGTAGLAQANRLIAAVGPSIVTVQGADATGARTSGSGFVMDSTANQSWLITSYHLVAGSIAAAQGLPVGATGTPTTTATVAPPTLGVTPTVTVHVGGSDRTGTVYSWDASHDLALVIVGAGSVPALMFSSAVPTQGLPVWAVGAADGPIGASAARGQLLLPTPQSYTTDAVFGPRASGGPLVDSEGRVVGVLTAAQPTGASPTPTPTPTGTATGLAIPVRLACVQVVICPR